MTEEGEGRAHLPRSWLQGGDWSLSTGTTILFSLPHRWAATGSQVGAAEGEKDFKARSLWQPRLKAHIMLFGLRKGIVSIYHHIKITPGGKQRGKRHRQSSLQAELLHQAWIWPPGGSGRLRFPE